MDSKLKYIKEDETIDDLQLKNLNLIQKKGGFKFGIDAVLLSDFANVKNKHKVIDLCTGTGVIPFLIYGKYEPQSVYGLEIQEDMVDMAKRSVKLNSLDESALSRFTYLDDQLLFDGESINNIVNLSTYTTDDLIEGTNKYVTNTEITNWNNIKTEVETARGIYTNVGNRLNAINLGIFSQVINLEGLTIGDFTLTRNPVLIGNVTLS